MTDKKPLREKDAVYYIGEAHPHVPYGSRGRIDEIVPESEEHPFYCEFGGHDEQWSYYGPFTADQLTDTFPGFHRPEKPSTADSREALEQQLGRLNAQIDDLKRQGEEVKRQLQQIDLDRLQQKAGFCIGDVVIITPATLEKLTDSDWQTGQRLQVEELWERDGLIFARVYNHDTGWGVSLPVSVLNG